MTEADPRAGQEAARLFVALQEWVRTSTPHLAPVAPDGTPCSCPVCRAVAGLRDADPHLVATFVDNAVSSLATLAAQAADLLAGATSPAGAAGSADEDATEADATEADDTDEGDDDEDATDEVVGDRAPDEASATDASERVVRRIVIEREA